MAAVRGFSAPTTILVPQVHSSLNRDPRALRPLSVHRSRGSSLTLKLESTGSWIHVRPLFHGSPPSGKSTLRRVSRNGPFLAVRNTQLRPRFLVMPFHWGEFAGAVLIGSVWRSFLVRDELTHP